jgi:hypothetical protein
MTGGAESAGARVPGAGEISPNGRSSLGRAKATPETSSPTSPKKQCPIAWLTDIVELAMAWLVQVVWLPQRGPLFQETIRGKPMLTLVLMIALLAGMPCVSAQAKPVETIAREIREATLTHVSGNGKDTKYGNGGFCGYLKRDYHSREYWVSKEG